MKRNQVDSGFNRITRTETEKFSGMFNSGCDFAEERISKLVD